MNGLLEYLSLFRTVWIGGRLGFGKTALATLLAKMLLEAALVDGACSNYPTILPVNVFGKDDGTCYNKVYLWDEAWQDLDSRTSMTNDPAVGAFMRKFGMYLILPSVHPIDRRLRAIEILPLYRNVFTGNLTWQYVVRDGNTAEPTRGTFSVDIKQAYGLYATSFIPTSDCGLMARFRNTFYLDTGTHYDDRNRKDRQAAEIAAFAGAIGS